MNIKSTLEMLDKYFYKFTHWHLIEVTDWSIKLFIGLYLLSTIYNTIFLYPITHPDFMTFTINPLMYEHPIFWHLNKGFHHTWDLIALLSFFFVMVYHYKIPPIMSLFRLTFIVAVHESAWYIIYPFTHPYWLYAWIFTPVQLAYIIIISSYIYLGYKTKRWVFPSCLLAVMILWSICWLSIGMPITVDFLGLTEYWMDATINALEITIWVFAILSYWTDITIENELRKEGRLK